jgi:DNA-binding IclR family transcriptional regulator
VSQSVARALQLLVALQGSPASLDELATLVGVHKTTVLRLLRTLEDDRFVTHDSHHRYTLGSRLFELANGALEKRDIRSVARAHLERLNAQSGQTVHLATMEAGTVIYIDKLDALTGVRMYSRVGLPAPLHCTAVAKVLVAALPGAAREQIASTLDYRPMTANTITTSPAYLAELDTVFAQGYAEDREEHESFINCIAAPILDGTGRVVAAVSLSVPQSALDHAAVLALLPALLDTADAVSADLGWSSSSSIDPPPTKGRP